MSEYHELTKIQMNNIRGWNEQDQLNRQWLESKLSILEKYSNQMDDKQVREVLGLTKPEPEYCNKCGHKLVSDPDGGFHYENNKEVS